MGQIAIWLLMSYKPTPPAAALGFVDPSAMFNMVQRMTQDRRRNSLVYGNLGDGSTQAGSNPSAPDRFQSFLSAMTNKPGPYQ